jgi:hypothetical protein
VLESQRGGVRMKFFQKVSSDPLNDVVLSREQTEQAAPLVQPGDVVGLMQALGGVRQLGFALHTTMYTEVFVSDAVYLLKEVRTVLYTIRRPTAFTPSRQWACVAAPLSEPSCCWARMQCIVGVSQRGRGPVRH